MRTSSPVQGHRALAPRKAAGYTNVVLGASIAADARPWLRLHASSDDTDWALAFENGLEADLEIDEGTP